MTTSNGPKQAKNVKDSREARLAEALRANLRRRKAAGIPGTPRKTLAEGQKSEKPNG